MTEMTTEKILDAAIDYVHEYGWCRGRIIDNQGRVCLQGALAKGAGMSGLSDLSDLVGMRAWQAVLGMRAWQAVREAVGFHPLVWNDIICRDADDAIHMLKKAKEFL